jgi:hypothetical protein
LTRYGNWVTISLVSSTTNNRREGLGRKELAMSTTTTLIPTDWVCMTCGRHLDDAYRLFDADGNVIEGCISGAHNDHADDWHNRPSAIAHRNGEAPVPNTGVIAAAEGTPAWVEFQARVAAICAELDELKAQRDERRSAA